MITKEDVVAEIENVPEQHLAKLYQIIKQFEEQVNCAEESVLVKLRQIRISAASDFSTKVKLYDVEEPNAKESLP